MIVRALACCLPFSFATAGFGADTPKPPSPAKVLNAKGLTKGKATPLATPWIIADDLKVQAAIEDFRKAASEERAAAKKVKLNSSTIKKERTELADAEKDYATLDGYKKNPDTIPARSRPSSARRSSCSRPCSSNTTPISSR